MIPGTNYLVGAGKDRLRYFEVERYCEPKIDDEFVARGLLNREIPGSRTLPDFVDIDRRVAK